MPHLEKVLEPEPELEGFASLPPGMAPACAPFAAEGPGGPEVPMRLPPAPLIPSRDLSFPEPSVAAAAPVPPADRGPDALVDLPTVPQLPLRSSHQSAATNLGQGAGGTSRTRRGGALAQSVCEGSAQDASPVWTKSLRRLLEMPVVPPRDDDGRSGPTRVTGIEGSGTASGGRPLPPPRFGNDGGVVPPPVPPR